MSPRVPFGLWATRGEHWLALAHGIIICNRKATKDLAMAAGRGFESLADASIIICNRRATKDLAMPAGQGNASREGL